MAPTREAEAENLARGVASMWMDGKGSVNGEQASDGGMQKVSGLNSYAGSSSVASHGKVDYVGMHERLCRAAMDVDKQKRTMEMGVMALKKKLVLLGSFKRQSKVNLQRNVARLPLICRQT